MSKCAHCSSVIINDTDICYLCGIDNKKEKRYLSKKEEKTISLIRNIRLLGLLTAGLGVLRFFNIFLLPLFLGDSWWLQYPTTSDMFFHIIFSFYQLLFIVVGFAMWFLKRWGTYGAIILWGGSVLITLLWPSDHIDPIEIIIFLLLVIIIAKPISRDLLR